VPWIPLAQPLDQNAAHPVIRVGPKTISMAPNAPLTRRVKMLPRRWRPGQHGIAARSDRPPSGHGQPLLDFKPLPAQDARFESRVVASGNRF